MPPQVLWGTSIFILILLAVGSACLFFPHAVQRAAMRNRVPGLVSSYIESSWYIVGLRAIGVVSLLAAVFLLLVLWKGNPNVTIQR